MNRTATGQVFLVGAGPGDPDLLTLKAFKVLRRADVIVYDRLINNEILEIAPRNCKLVYAGKRKHLHTLSQKQINETLVEQAQRGLTVVRLKGGDAFVFGRGGEEAEALNAAGVPWQVVPGITAGVGAAANSGIPLTHRDHAQAVTFMTAHRRTTEGQGRFELDWALATRPNQTVVFYMATSVARELVLGLVEHGLSTEHHLSIVTNATLPNEHVETFTLSSFLSRDPKVSAPAVIILHETPVLSRVAAAIDMIDVQGEHDEHHQYQYDGVGGRFG